jgi:hypothetical protein
LYALIGILIIREEEGQLEDAMALLIIRQITIAQSMMKLKENAQTAMSKLCIKATE